MEKCQYKDVEQNSEQFTKFQESTNWKPFLKQVSENTSLERSVIDTISLQSWLKYIV